VTTASCHPPFLPVKLPVKMPGSVPPGSVTFGSPAAWRMVIRNDLHAANQIYVI
jgi:hypothetical protein